MKSRPCFIQHTRGWYLEMWKAMGKFYGVSMAYYMEWGLFGDWLSPEACLQIPRGRFCLLFCCVLAFPSAGCPLCLPSRMRECRCSWELLCVDVLEARCWEKRWSSKGDLRARGRKAAGEGFLAYGDTNRPQKTRSFLLMAAGTCCHKGEVLLYSSKFSISKYARYSWIFCLSHWGPEIAIQCVSGGECF